MTDPAGFRRAAAAHELGVSVSTLDTMIRLKQIRAVRGARRCVIVPKTEIENFLSGGKVADATEVNEWVAAAQA